MNIFKRIGKFFSNIFKRKSKRDEVIIPTSNTIPKVESVKTVSKPIELVKNKKDEVESLIPSDRDNIKVEPIISEVIETERDTNVVPVRTDDFELTPITPEEPKSVVRESLTSIDDFTSDESYNKALDVLDDSKFIYSIANFIASNRAALSVDDKSFRNMSFKETKYSVLESLSNSRSGKLNSSLNIELRTAVKDFANIVRENYDLESGKYKDVSSNPQYNSIITRVGRAIVGEFGKTRAELMRESKSYDIDRMGL